MFFQAKKGAVSRSYMKTRSLSHFYRSCCWLLLLGVPPDDGLPPEVTGHPQEIAGPIPNPYMGIGLWARHRYYGMNPEKHYSMEDLATGFGDDAPLFNWVLVDWDWASLEPREGQFDWKEFTPSPNIWQTGQEACSSALGH